MKTRIYAAPAVKGLIYVKNIETFACTVHSLHFHTSMFTVFLLTVTFLNTKSVSLSDCISLQVYIGTIQALKNSAYPSKHKTFAYNDVDPTLYKCYTDVLCLLG